MIRRDVQLPDGQPAWVLISQVDHALLSGKLAEAWSWPPNWPPAQRAELQAAIAHHDDGWSQWEQCPQLSPSSGRPLAFTEMPLREALAIWRKSIEGAERFGQLAPFAIAGHFLALLAQFDSWRSAGAESLDLGTAFEVEFRRRKEVWLANWQAALPGINTPDLAAEGVAWVQFFDRLSLWLCCAERMAPESFAPPQGPPCAIAPQSSGRMAVQPWPFATAPLDVAVPGRQIAAMAYQSAAELAAASEQIVSLAWRLQPTFCPTEAEFSPA